ncbi:hypothetical protein QCD71_07250 [Sphingomonas sp. PsM26]|nr:hypothetical protein [Sphingomonas sp. PsM26]
MFSLIALYIQYRKAQSADAAALGATASKIGPANDAADIGIARAA